MEKIGPHGDLSDEHAAVGRGDHAELLLARRFSGGELGDGAAGGGLGRLAARVGVDLGVHSRLTA
jgi:hypothetical protein